MNDARCQSNRISPEKLRQDFLHRQPDSRVVFYTIDQNPWFILVQGQALIRFGVPINVCMYVRF